jgi:hypothetical protein
MRRAYTERHREDDPSREIWDLAVYPSSGFEIDYRYGAASNTHRLAVLIFYLHLPHLAPATGVDRRPDGGQILPARLGLRWLAFISEPNAALPGGQFKKAPMLATDSARTTLTPPCR